MSMYITPFEMRILRIMAREQGKPALSALCDELGEADRLKVERAVRRVDAFAHGLNRCKRGLQTGPLDGDGSPN